MAPPSPACSACHIEDLNHSRLAIAEEIDAYC